MEENIDVCIRVRPLNERETKAKDAHILHCVSSMNAISITDRYGTPLPGPAFQYDHIFSESVPTSTIYNEVAKRIVLSTLKGINGTIFAYGQTSSGKTHTMHGDVHTELGILPLAVEHIFSYIEQSTDRDFLIRVSYVEIYNEVIRDLLCDDKDKCQTSLKIREDPKKGIYVESQEEIITDYDAIFRLLDQGEQRRTVGQTTMNERSSRSHSIFRIVIESKKKSAPTNTRGSVDDAHGGVLVGVLNLVDLAGSESVRHTASEGMRLREASNINRSLLTLSRVINSLAQGAESIQNAPFRDSKLTRLLQSSLAGSTRTLIICCVTPSDRHLEESKSTLQFAARAKNIQLSASVNEVLDDQAQLQRLKREVVDLRHQVDNNPVVHALKAENDALSEVKSLHEAKIQRLLGLMATSTTINAPPNAKPKPKRTRETWGPGDVLHSLQQRSSTSLEQVILHELQTSSQVAKKQRKARRLSDEQASITTDDDDADHHHLVTHLKSQLDAKDRMIRQLQSSECAACCNHEDKVKQLETLLHQADADRSALESDLEQARAEVQQAQCKQAELTQKVEAFDQLLEESETSASEAMEQNMLLETQHCQVQVQLADQLNKAHDAELALVALQEKCDRYEAALEASSNIGAANNEALDDLVVTHKVEAMLQAQAEQHAKEVMSWAAKIADLEQELGRLRTNEEAKSMQVAAASALQAENQRLREESVTHESALAESKAAVEALEQAAADHAKTLLDGRIVQTTATDDDHATQLLAELRTAKDAEIATYKAANRDLLTEFEQATLKFETEVQSVKRELEAIASQRSALQLDKEAAHAEIAQLQDTIAQQAERLGDLMQQVASGESASVRLEELERCNALHQEELRRLERIADDALAAKTQLGRDLEHAEVAKTRQLHEQAQTASLTLAQVVADHDQAQVNSNETIDRLTTANRELTQQGETLRVEVTKLNAERTSLLERTEELSKQVEAMTLELASVVDEHKVKLNESCHSLQVDMAKLEQSHGEEREVLRKQVEDLQDQVINANIELLQKQEKIAGLVVEIEASQAAVANLADIPALEDRLANMATLNNELQASADKHSVAEATLEDIVANLKGDVSTLKAQLESQTVSYQNKVVQVQEMQDAHSALELALQTMQSKNEVLQESLQSTNAHCATVEAKVGALLESLAEKDGQIVQLQEELQTAELTNAQTQAGLDDAVAERTKALAEEAKRMGLVNEELRVGVDKSNAMWREKVDSIVASRDAEVAALAGQIQALELKIQNMEERNSNGGATSPDDVRSLNAQLGTLQNELDAQLEEKEALYDKIDELEKAALCNVQNQHDHVRMLQRQWDMEKATLTDRLGVQRDRINKLELVKMTKGHLEVFEKLKLNIKKKTDEVAALQQQLQASRNDDGMALMEERWRYEQTERKVADAKLAEVKLKLHTTQNEFQIKTSEVASLQNAIVQYEGHIDTLENQIRVHGTSSTEIDDLRRHVADLERLVQSQSQQLRGHQDNIQSLTQLRDQLAQQVAELQQLVRDKDVQLKRCEDDAASKQQEWQVAKEDLHEKFHADLRYLEKENLELHLELKQTKRLMSSTDKGIASPPLPRARTSLSEIEQPKYQSPQLPSPSSLTKSLLGPSKALAVDDDDKENTPAVDITTTTTTSSSSSGGGGGSDGMPSECNQQ